MGGGGQGGALGRQVQPPCSRSPVWPVSCSSRGLGWCLSSHNRICLACPGHLRAAWAVSVHASAGPALGAFRTQGLTTLWAACVLVCVSSVSGLSASRAHSCIQLHTATQQLNFVCPSLLCVSLQALRRLNCPCACPSCAGLSTGCSARVTWSRGGRSRRGRGGSWTLPPAPARPGQVRAGGGPLCGRPTAAAHRCSSRLTAAHIRVCEQRRGQTPVLCNWHTAATEPASSCSPCASSNSGTRSRRPVQARPASGGTPRCGRLSSCSRPKRPCLPRAKKQCCGRVCVCLCDIV